jgi:hypothetical protein
MKISTKPRIELNIDRFELINSLLANSSSPANQVILYLEDNTKVSFNVNGIEKEDGSGQRFLISGYSKETSATKFYYDFSQQKGSFI